MRCSIRIVLSHHSLQTKPNTHMKISKILTEHRNDFTALMECEHCGHQQRNDYGYHDNYYHTKVIPAMYCQSPTCGKNRAGETKPEPQPE